jgi:hypothetical protein
MLVLLAQYFRQPLITVSSVARFIAAFTGTKAGKVQVIDPGRSVATCG